MFSRTWARRRFGPSSRPPPFRASRAAAIPAVRCRLPSPTVGCGRDSVTQPKGRRAEGSARADDDMGELCGVCERQLVSATAGVTRGSAGTGAHHARGGAKESGAAPAGGGARQMAQGLVRIVADPYEQIDACGDGGERFARIAQLRAARVILRQPRASNHRPTRSSLRTRAIIRPSASMATKRMSSVRSSSATVGNVMAPWVEGAAV